MAINSLEVHCNKPLTKSHCSSNSSKTGAGNLSSCRLVKINFATEGSICSTASRRGRKKNFDSKSPYLNRDSSNVHIQSQVVQKKGSKIVSSFPLAVNIYKANSDEFKGLKNTNKKAKKSVLTLPNDQAPIPKTCTVSDMNDSEYFNKDEDRKKFKKRNPRNRQSKPKGRDYEFYDRDARFCSQMNLDCSSTDLIQKSNRAEKQNGRTKSVVGSKRQVEEKSDPHDVWAVLRNINRFQFRPSPPMSEDSFAAPKKKKGPKRRNNRKDMRVVETCRTEEFAYISSYEVDSRSPHSYSRSSSFDRVTVIDKQDDFSKMCEEFEKMVTAKDFVRGATNKPQIQNPRANCRNAIKPNTKGYAQRINYPKDLPIEYNAKKQSTGNCGDALHTKQNKLRGSRDTPILDDTVKYEFDNPLYAEEINDNRTFKNEGKPVVQSEFIYSGNSGSSSKAACISETFNKGGKNKMDKQQLSTYELNQQLNGITKVVLSKGQNQIPPKKSEPPKRQRHVPMSASQLDKPKVTNNTIIPKLTQTEIKRRLAKLKFPIVVLGKDQLSSTYELSGLAPTQFDGLTEQIWPFMLEWQNNDGEKREKAIKVKNIDQSQNKKISADILQFNKSQKINRGLISTKKFNIDKKPAHDSKNNNKIKVEQKRVVPPAELIDQSQPKKTKSIRQFKEKILNLLYKNSSVHNENVENKPLNGNSFVKVRPASKTDTKIDAGTDTRIRMHCKEIPRNPINSPVKTSKPVPTKQPWARARWASDFIDNVIRKIKNGVYYTHESKLSNQNHKLKSKEAEIQTISTNTEVDPAMHSISKITIKKKSDAIAIPGFDNTQPALEIKTMNSYEIAVRHCVTNIMVRFDVTVPNEPALNLRKSSSLIPLDVTGSNTKIFKCKTSIINSMLPAELCSILPKMMWSIIESNQALTLPVVVDKPAFQLSTISEISHYESLEPFKIPLFPQVRMTPELLELISGIYRNETRSHNESNKKVKVDYNAHFADELLPRLSLHSFDYIADPTIRMKISKQKPALSFVKEAISRHRLNTCMALERYPASDRRLVLATSLMQFDISSFLRKMSSYVIDNISSCSQAFNSLFDKNITVSLIQTNSEGLQDSISINISRFMINATLDITKTDNRIEKKYLPAIECIDSKESLDKNVESSTSVNKTKNKGFVKLYRKCKSTSNISAERATTALSKITNLDEFFQALGTKLFSGVFDNHYSQKILTSLKEMKKWITDINPTQALLVLLLMNKKDTPNLVRFRPVLLQGIAGNRITRANELDMEIEVIEREHLNRLSQYNGMSYLPESVENQDNLLEELCWIAKTTASDYQRPFDDSSEKLLKALLEKRKKLNPSYLRVMARYVGLGLLKTPVKK